MSWSQVVALHCDMGTGASQHAEAMQHPATAAADAHTSDHAPLARHGRGHDGDPGCLMIMACGYSFVRHAQQAVTGRFPGTVVGAPFLANPIPVAAVLAVEAPPPRLTA